MNQGHDMAPWSSSRYVHDQVKCSQLARSLATHRTTYAVVLKLSVRRQDSDETQVLLS